MGARKSAYSLMSAALCDLGHLCHEVCQEQDLPEPRIDGCRNGLHQHQIYPDGVRSLGMALPRPPDLSGAALGRARPCLAGVGCGHSAVGARGLRVAARRTRSAPAAAALALLSLGPRVPLAGPRLLAPVVAALAHPPARSAFLPSPLCRPGGPWAPCGALGPFPASSGLGASGLRAAAAALAACSAVGACPPGCAAAGPSGARAAALAARSPPPPGPPLAGPLAGVGAPARPAFVGRGAGPPHGRLGLQIRAGSA